MLRPMNLEQIALLLGAQADRPLSGITVADLSYDSRRTRPGDLFFCIDGSELDGHLYAALAVEAGAVGLVCERRVLPEEGGQVPQLLVPDSRAAMSSLAAPFFGWPSRSLNLVGVTGTNGKTTTTFMLDSIFRVESGSSGLIGTVESRVGNSRRPAARTTPEAVDIQRLLREMLQAKVTRCAMEVTSIGIDGGRIEGTQFDVAVFTNLTHEHLDHHLTMERYFNSKARLFTDPAPGAAVINLDDAYGRRLAARVKVPTLTFGLESDAALQAREVCATVKGSEFTAMGSSLHERVKVNLPGRFNVANALAAIGSAQLMGIGPQAAAAGIEELRYVPGRLEPVWEGQTFHVFVDYAHTPDGLDNVLRAARELAPARVLAVFGCGGDRDRTKRPLMGQVAARHSDIAFITSDNPRSEDPGRIIAQIEQGLVDGPPPGGYQVIPDRRQAIRQALMQARAQDIVVIAGKGHETGQEQDGTITSFDDRLVASELLRELL